MGYFADPCNPWTTGDPCTDWLRVTCDSDGYVTDIDLSNIGFFAQPPGFLGLDIKAFAPLGSLSRIQFIRLSNTGMVGSLPDLWAEATTLVIIDAANNFLAGQETFGVYIHTIFYLEDIDLGLLASILNK